MAVFIYIVVFLQTAMELSFAASTHMIVADAGTSRVYRMVVGDNDINDYDSTFYNVDGVGGFRDLDYDFLEDRLYIVQPLSRIYSVFVNGTSPMIVADFNFDQSHSIAVDPYEKLVFVALDPHTNSQQIVSMTTNGTDQQVLVETDSDIANIGVDYVNQYVYWTQYDLTGDIYRVFYNGSDRETVATGLIMKRNLHGIDFKNNIMYGDGWRGLYAYLLDEEREEIILQGEMGHPQSDMTFDPRTNRTFLTNNREYSTITVYRVSSENGADLGTIRGVHLTRSANKAIRVNPLGIS